MDTPLSGSAKLSTELLAGEHLLWTGQPSRSVIFHPTDWFAIPFSLLWGGFAIFWELGVTGLSQNSKSDSLSWFMSLWGIPFILGGQYMIWGRFCYIAWRKRHVYYALSNRRVLVLVEGRTRKLISSPLSALTMVSLTTRPDGMGTIAFSPKPESDFFSPFSGRQGRGTPPWNIQLASLTFYDIPEAKGIYQQIEVARSR